MLSAQNEQVEVVMSPATPGSVTELLVKWRGGDQEALQALLPLVYNELRRLARRRLQAERPHHTLQSTELVHEAYLRLAKSPPQEIENRLHFLAIASQLMREILVDYGRRRRASKRGGGCKITLNEAIVSAPNNELDVLVLDEALTSLSQLDGQQAKVVELRFFGGLSIEESSQVLGISPATVKRDWATARAWLKREIEGAAPA
jgi:RNA polymerase sigma factor (TIGR02999 family)